MDQTASRGNIVDNKHGFGSVGDLFLIGVNRLGPEIEMINML